MGTIPQVRPAVGHPGLSTHEVLGLAASADVDAAVAAFNVALAEHEAEPHSGGGALVGITLINAEPYGATPGGRMSDAVTTAGSGVVNSASGGFAAAAIGDLVAIRGAGADDGSGYFVDHWSTISAKASSTQVTMAHVAVTATTGSAHFGADAKAAIEAAHVAAGAAGGGEITAEPGVYMVSSSCQVLNVSNVSFSASFGVTIRYRSGNKTVADPTGGGFYLRGQAALCVRNSHHYLVEKLWFEGDWGTTEVSYAGPAVYAMAGSTHVHFDRVKLRYGGCLLYSDSNTGEVGARLDHCYSYGARLYNALPPGSTVTGLHLELPTDTSYDRRAVDAVSYGSTHGLYIFGSTGARGAAVSGSWFYNVRTTAIKVSGSSASLRGFPIVGNGFLDCGAAMVFGADDRQEHSGLSYTGNWHYNCSTNRAGWGETAAVQVYGSKGVTVTGNNFYYDRDSIRGPDGISAILVSGSVPPDTTAAQEAVTVADNNFLGRIGAGFASAPPQIISKAVTCWYIGNRPLNVTSTAGSLPLSTATIYSLFVHHNNVVNVGHSAYNFDHCAGLVCESNMAAGTTRWGELYACRRPWMRNNRMSPGASTGAQVPMLLMADNTFPVFDGNTGNPVPLGLSSGAAGGGRGQTFGTTDNAGGSSLAAFPLRGKGGRAAPSEGRAEVVFAVGAIDQWLDGDYIAAAGTVYTFKTTSPNAGALEWNTLAGLVTLLDANADLTATDYGAEHGGVTTRHIRLRRAVAGATTFTFYGACSSPCGLDYLPNMAPPDQGICQAVGAQSGGVNNQTVLWSPLTTVASAPNFVAMNTAARTLLAAGGFMLQAVDPWEGGGPVVIEHDAADGTERFGWAIVG